MGYQQFIHTKRFTYFIHFSYYLYFQLFLSSLLNVKKNRRTNRTKRFIISCIDESSLWRTGSNLRMRDRRTKSSTRARRWGGEGRRRKKTSRGRRSSGTTRKYSGPGVVQSSCGVKANIIMLDYISVAKIKYYLQAPAVCWAFLFEKDVWFLECIIGTILVFIYLNIYQFIFVNNRKYRGCRRRQRRGRSRGRWWRCWREGSV